MQTHRNGKPLNLVHIPDIPLDCSYKDFSDADKDFINDLHENDAVFQVLEEVTQDEFIDEQLEATEVAKGMDWDRPQYVPSPYDIKTACQKIRSQWTPLERYQRLSSAYRYSQVKYSKNPIRHDRKQSGMYLVEAQE